MSILAETISPARLRPVEFLAVLEDGVLALVSRAGRTKEAEEPRAPCHSSAPISLLKNWRHETELGTDSRARVERESATRFRCPLGPCTCSPRHEPNDRLLTVYARSLAAHLFLYVCESVCGRLFLKSKLSRVLR